MRVVVGLAFLLLVVEFRALLVPAMAVGLNLLAVGAAYGPVVAVFQWGWGHLSLLGSEPGPIESFAPVMLFAVLFGLSTDYAVFLLSRVREGFQHTGDVRRAMREGIAATGRVILAARRSWWSSSPASCSTTSGWSTCSASAWRWRCTRRWRCSFWSPRCCRSWAAPPGGPAHPLAVASWHASRAPAGPERARRPCGTARVSRPDRNGCRGGLSEAVSTPARRER